MYRRYCNRVFRNSLTQLLRFSTEARSSFTESLTVANNQLRVSWKDGKSSSYSLTWLRAFCPLDSVSTGQKTNNIGDFYGKVHAQHAELKGMLLNHN